MKKRVIRNQAKKRVLDFLLWRAGKQFYEKEIAEGSKVSKSAVNQILKELIKDKWLSLTEKGRLNFYEVNFDSVLVRNYKRNLTISKLDKLISFLKGKAERLILFGSAAKGEDLTGSDLDLAIVTKQQLETKKILKLMPKDRKVELIIKTPDGFRELRDKNKVLYQAILQGERLI